MDEKERTKGQERRKALIENLNRKEETLKERELRERESSEHGQLTEEEMTIRMEIERQRSRRGFAGPV